MTVISSKYTKQCTFRTCRAASVNVDLIKVTSNVAVQDTFTRFSANRSLLHLILFSSLFVYTVSSEYGQSFVEMRYFL